MQEQRYLGGIRVIQHCLLVWGILMTTSHVHLHTLCNMSYICNMTWPCSVMKNAKRDVMLRVSTLWGFRTCYRQSWTSRSICIWMNEWMNFLPVKSVVCAIEAALGRTWPEIVNFTYTQWEVAKASGNSFSERKDVALWLWKMKVTLNFTWLIK